MNRKLLLNDLKRNKVINFSIGVFISLGAMLIALAITLAINLVGSIDHMMESAETPHFLQMHQGDIDMERLQQFADDNENVSDFQVLEFLNVEGHLIEINGISQRDSVQDNGLSVQPENFDFLIDLDNEIVEVNPGEIYLPIMFFKEGIIDVGDDVVIGDETFELKGFFRDSQMNSNMAGSKRYLIHESDFEKLEDLGSVEYLIEFLLIDPSEMTAFEHDYLNNNVENNGPMVTYTMFRLINGISDGIVISVLLVSSALIIVISLLCLRFILLAKLEEEYREIVVMRVIGIRLREIRSFYLGKYSVITAVFVVIGYMLSLIIQDSLLESIYLYMGRSDMSGIALYISIMGVFVLFLFIILYLRMLLNRIKKIAPLDSIRNINPSEGKSKPKRLFRKLNPNVALGLTDILSRKSLYITIALQVIFSVFLILVPQNLHNTFKDPSFITYLGIGEVDLSIEIQQVEAPLEKMDEMVTYVEDDADVRMFSPITTHSEHVILPNDQEAVVKIDIGDHSLFPINYASGTYPENESEIAVSELYMDDLELELGDFITVVQDGESFELEVVGTYSDISDGGKTAKASYSSSNESVINGTIYIELEDATMVDEVEKRYMDEFSYAKVASIAEYIDQSFGETLKQINFVSLITAVVSLAVIAFVTLLFTRLLLARDKTEIALLQTLGFTSNDVSMQYIWRFVIILLVSIPIAILMSNTVTQYIALALVSSFGVTSIRFIINPFVTYMVVPLLIFVVTLSTIRIATSDIKRFKISENIKE